MSDFSSIWASSNLLSVKLVGVRVDSGFFEASATELGLGDGFADAFTDALGDAFTDPRGEVRGDADAGTVPGHELSVETGPTWV